MKHIWFVPSNQLKNIVYGDPNPAPGPTTEEQLAIIRTYAGMEDAKRSGWATHLAYIPGAGTSSLDELLTALDRMQKAMKQYQAAGAEVHALSYHSDASGHQDIYPLIPIDSTAEKLWANAIAKDMATRCGFPGGTDPATYRPDLAYSRRIDDFGPFHGLLMEIGVHGPTGGAMYGMKGQAALWLYAQFHGVMAFRAYAKGVNGPLLDGPLPTSVALPPGYEKWHDGSIGLVIPAYTRLLKLTDPLMRGEDIRFVQKALLALGYSVGTYGADGFYGKDTKAGVIAFQKKTWPTVPSEWDGIVGPLTWAALVSAYSAVA